MESILTLINRADADDATVEVLEEVLAVLEYRTLNNIAPDFDVMRRLKEFYTHKLRRMKDET